MDKDANGRLKLVNYAMAAAGVVLLAYLFIPWPIPAGGGDTAQYAFGLVALLGIVMLPVLLSVLMYNVLKISLGKSWYEWALQQTFGVVGYLKSFGLSMGATILLSAAYILFFANFATIPLVSINPVLAFMTAFLGIFFIVGAAGNIRVLG